MANIGAPEWPDVAKPLCNGEETAAMLDREQEVVMLVKQRQPFSACLLRDTEYGRLDLDIEEIIVKTDPLCMPSDAVI